jgi:hypothetical protein
MSPEANPTHTANTANRQQLLTLLNLLEEETRQYEAVSAKLREKQDILVANTPKKLPRLDQELTAIGHKARQLEQQRQGLMGDMGYPNHTLSQLIGEMDPQTAATFIPCRDRLRHAAHEAKRLNQDTRDLLELSMQWIQDTVELIANALTPEASSYNAQGNKAGTRNSTAQTTPVQSTINHSA